MTLSSVQSNTIALFKPNKKIAVIIPIAYRGGSLRGAIALINSLINGALALNDRVDVVFGYIDSPEYNNDMFSDLHPSVQRRPYQWEILDKNEALRAMNYAGLSEWVPEYHQYIYPNDGISQFLDCDLWLIISDRLNRILLPIKPHILMIYDCIQRYISLSSKDDEQQLIINAHQALRILTTTEFTKNDVLQYAGVSAAKVFKMPVLVSDFKCLPSIEPSNYFIWPTNLAAHKNHINSFYALKRYYDDHNGSLECHITGVSTEQLCDCYPVLDAILKSSLKMRKMVIFCGELSDVSYKNKLKGAAFLFHTATIDNGTLAIIEAAQMGVPALSHDYPPMREKDKQFSLEIFWMNATSTDDITNKLIKFETNYFPLKEKLIAKNRRQFMNTSEDEMSYWMVIKSCL